MISARSTAKLNLTLKITGTRPDGYHLLDSLFCSVDLHDKLTITPGQDACSTVCSPEQPIVNNLATRAALLFYQQAGISGGCRIRLEKRIPMEAGLGGGSGDAAAVLKALNEHFDHPFSEEALFALALQLGADIPFALKGGLARVTGIGETHTHLHMRRSFSFVIAKPAQGLSTQQMYACYDASPSGLPIDNDAFYRALLALDGAAMRAYGGNDLQPAAEKYLPIIAQLQDKLYQSGALYAAMTGSGSAVFGLFPSYEQAHIAQASLHSMVPYCVCCQSLV